MHVLGALFFIGAVVIYLLVLLTREDPRNRVWCACRINDRVGLVPRDVYNEASARFWHETRQERGPYSGPPLGVYIRIPWEEMIVLSAQGREYHTLTKGVLLEAATFFVPGDKKTIFANAYMAVHGKPWDGQLISWKDVYHPELTDDDVRSRTAGSAQ